MSVESFVKGMIGEVQTRITQELLDPRKHKSYNNILIKTEDDSTQIDHIIVSRYGIFVVETKRWDEHCYIYAGEKNSQWTVYNRGKKYFVQNPLRQNYKHRMMLSEYLVVESEKIFSIVYIWGGCKFRKGIPENVICEKSALSNGIGYIKEIAKRKRRIILSRGS